MLSDRMTACAGFLLLAMLFLLVSISDNSEAATYTVDNLGGADYTNITQAVDNASAGDTIKVAARTYHDAVEVDKRLTIVGGNHGVDKGDLYDCDSGDLVTRYRFEDGAGGTAYDDVWCGDLNGDIEGASWTTGIWDYALDFDGSNDYVEIDHDSAFNVSAVSVSAWINLDDNDTSNLIIVSTFGDYGDGSTDKGGYELKITSDANLRFRYGYGNGYSYCTSSSEIAENKWYLVTATHDGSSTIKLYINDELDTTCTGGHSLSSNLNPLLIGSADWDNSGTPERDWFDGTIDEVALWSDVLTASEVEILHWGGSSAKPIVNASNGGYAFKVTADSAWLKYFEVQYSGPDLGDSSGDGGVIVNGADSVKISEFYFKYNRHAIKVIQSDDVEIYGTHIWYSGGALKKGLLAYESNNLFLNYGYYSSASEAGIHLLHGQGIRMHHLTIY